MTTDLITNRGSIEGSKNALMKDLKTVAGDVDSVLKEIANASTEEFAAARTRMEAKLGAARSSLDEARMAMADRAKHAADVTQKYVSDNPWKALGVMAAAGLIIGVLSSRR